MPFSGVSIFEGIELRNAGIKSDILIFSKLNTSYLDLALDHNLILNMSNLEDLYVIKRFSKQNENSPRFHVKFDTGMTRLGLNINEADDIAMAESLSKARVFVLTIWFLLLVEVWIGVAKPGSTPVDQVRLETHQNIEYRMG